MVTNFDKPRPAGAESGGTPDKLATLVGLAEQVWGKIAHAPDPSKPRRGLFGPRPLYTDLATSFDNGRVIIRNETRRAKKRSWVLYQNEEDVWCVAEQTRMAAPEEAEGASAVETRTRQLAPGAPTIFRREIFAADGQALPHQPAPVEEPPLGGTDYDELDMQLQFLLDPQAFIKAQRRPA